jgi:hypothetical protein
MLMWPRLHLTPSSWPAVGVWGSGGGGGGAGGGDGGSQEPPPNILDPITGLLKTEKYTTISTNITFQIAPFRADRDSGETICKNNGGSLAGFSTQQEQVGMGWLAAAWLLDCVLA